ncbi:hypothetical protein GCM10009736_23820 [Actinomadura bangladeshensis]
MKGVRGPLTGVVLAAVTLTTSGCQAMNDIGYEPKAADPETVRSQVEARLAGIKEMVDLPKGKGDPPAALINTEAQGVERGYSMTGSWSVWGLPDQEIGEGYARVRKALPSAGWKVVQEGRDAFSKQDPEIWAERTDDHSKLTIEWIKPRNDKGSVLLAMISSRIYVAPPDVDLNTKI